MSPTATIPHSLAELPGYHKNHIVRGLNVEPRCCAGEYRAKEPPRQELQDRGQDRHHTHLRAMPTSTFLSSRPHQGRPGRRLAHRVLRQQPQCDRGGRREMRTDSEMSSSSTLAPSRPSSRQKANQGEESLHNQTISVATGLLDGAPRCPGVGYPRRWT
jgi:hypothetical protein